MKKVRVRIAKPTDKGLFKKLWWEYMNSPERKNDDAVVNDHNLEVFVKLFEAYTSKTLKGVVLLVGEDAVLMHGSMGESPFQTKYDPFAIGFGVYVRPQLRGEGVSQQLYRKSFKILKGQGFRYIIGGVVETEKIDSHPAIKAGFVPHSMRVQINLETNSEEKR